MKRLTALLSILVFLLLPVFAQQAAQQQMMVSQKISAVASGSPFLTTNPTAAGRNDFTGCLGFSFTTPSSPVLTATDLGRWKFSGSSQSHTVYLKLADGTVVASAVVDFSAGGTDGAYNYTAITPAALTASTKYFVLSSETNGGDQWRDSFAYSSSGVATLGKSVFNTGCTGSPVEATTGESYVPTNIKLF